MTDFSPPAFGHTDSQAGRRQRMQFHLDWSRRQEVQLIVNKSGGFLDFQPADKGPGENIAGFIGGYGNLVYTVHPGWEVITAVPFDAAGSGGDTDQAQFGR